MVRICFVCLGNICRSPTAEGLMRHLISRAGLDEHIEVDSAGTGAYHAGEPADARSAAVARARGVHLTSIARQFVVQDFGRFDYVVAMDGDNHAELLRLAPHADARERVSLLRSFDGHHGDVPDPYYGGPSGFDDVFDLCERACSALLDHIRETHDL